MGFPIDENSPPIDALMITSMSSYMFILSLVLVVGYSIIFSQVSLAIIWSLTGAAAASTMIDLTMLIVHTF